MSVVSSSLRTSAKCALILLKFIVGPQILSLAEALWLPRLRRLESSERRCQAGSKEEYVALNYLSHLLVRDTGVRQLELVSCDEWELLHRLRSLHT